MSRAGKFRDEGVFETLTAGVDDGYGNTTDAWTPLFTLWVDFREMTARERVQNGALEGKGAARLYVRYSSESAQVTSFDRLQIRGEVWNITGIARAGRNNELIEMTVERGGAQ